MGRHVGKYVIIHVVFKFDGPDSLSLSNRGTLILRRSTKATLEVETDITELNHDRDTYAC